MCKNRSRSCSGSAVAEREHAKPSSTPGLLCVSSHSRASLPARRANVPTQSVTLHLPSPLYQRLKRRAEQAARPVEDELLDVVVAAVPGEEELSPEMTEELSTLSLLDDDTLWQTARTRMSPELSVELEELHLKRQREGLTASEIERARVLIRYYERSMLLRAQAAALLKQRGHDISALAAAE